MDECTIRFHCQIYWSAFAGCFSWPSSDPYEQSEALMVPWLARSGLCVCLWSLKVLTYIGVE